MRIPVLVGDLPKVQKPDSSVSEAQAARDAEVTSQYVAVDTAVQPLTGYIEGDLHRVLVNGTSRQPIGNLAFSNAILAFLQSPDTPTNIKFAVDSEDETMVATCKVLIKEDVIVDASHLQLGSISQAIKSVLRGNYTSFRWPTKDIGLSKVPEIIAEGEKIWGELKAVPNASVSKNEKGEDVILVGSVRVT